MANRYLVLILLILCVFSCKEKPHENTAPLLEERLNERPTSTFTDLEGKPVELADFKGQRILLNYWATWCKPCIEEMPAFLKAQKVLSQENYVFLFASDQSLEKIKAFKEKKQFDFNFLKLNGSLSDRQINALPATFFYNEAGEFVNRIDGAMDWNSEITLNKLKALK